MQHKLTAESSTSCRMINNSLKTAVNKIMGERMSTPDVLNAKFYVVLSIYH